MSAREDEWLWGWDPTPGVVSVWAEPDGRAFVWRRVGGRLIREDERFRPWLLLADLAHLEPRRGITVEELDGPGELRFLVRADDGRALARAVIDGVRRRTGRAIAHVRELGDAAVLALPPEEQYLVATGRTYFRDLAFDDLRRMQIDLETTGLSAADDQIFLIATRDPDGAIELIEGDDEARLIHALIDRVKRADPDVIENHNLHGFDLPFLAERARRLGIALALGRAGQPGLRTRASARGVTIGENDRERKIRYTVPGRELIDSMDATRRHDFAARDLPSHGLKAVAKHLGVAGLDREHIAGAHVHSVYQRDPARVRRYAGADVEEAAHVARLLGGAAFALARMVPRRYERLADAGPATGILDPLLVRAYLHDRAALPAHTPSDGTEHTGAGLHLFATGVAHRIVNADVASLYPSLMRTYRIGPARDRLGVLLALVDRLLDQRLAAKAARDVAMSAAMKLVINSAYGYLGAGGLTRFSDIHAANEVTRRGREVLELICTGLAARGLTLLEADTDGVYASAPASWTEADERRAIDEVAALLPARVKLELGGRYAAMLSHEPKNYALAPYGDAPLILRGVAFRSSRAERFGEHFLRRAIAPLLAGDIPEVQRVFIETIDELRKRRVDTFDVTQRVRLTKSPAEYLATRESRREAPYEAMLAGGRDTWHAGERIRFYRATRGRVLLYQSPDDDSRLDHDPRDYDVDYYVRLLRDTFATRLARALAPEDFAAVFADPDQPSLFAPSLANAKPILTVLP
ncbi:MAG TPA: 3'-5' exonuclease [Kofleriaceae bacterium]|nr:3'-5' exonuclease [Kofleriaceae bacterium]